jgi:hypothetical protein
MHRVLLDVLLLVIWTTKVCWSVAPEYPLDLNLNLIYRPIAKCGLMPDIFLDSAAAACQLLHHSRAT